MIDWPLGIGFFFQRAGSEPNDRKIQEKEEVRVFVVRLLRNPGPRVSPVFFDRSARSQRVEKKTNLESSEPARIEKRFSALDSNLEYRRGKKVFSASSIDCLLTT